jgi:sirohydrochlorin ferrochelatase
MDAARETQAREAERRYKAQFEAEATRLRTLREELRGVQLERARILAVILADLRVEAAALAQEKGWDAVLTQAIVSPGTVDATDELIARIRR